MHTPQACRARGMMVIFDEVMTGGFRLGAPTAASLLCLQPDIACFAKLVTGGALPMAATLTTERVFKAFEGDSKVSHNFSHALHSALSFS
ncbi:pyridoxal phosphate-dependent transferase [Dunaliella salina]|uniref:Pyridoxal phosphate-dependent transferase n=1 Tax=Dunaliella salina TaxID=3046 RepID=A0ABQ7H3I3_DUNSA|nr:pyridoxal phosphate-dependent transferase [Dunaliella salina]|eukprot:KAF5841429.1 pyridoxal phosphate-dependent transferase [Dunaliella salina]